MAIGAVIGGSGSGVGPIVTTASVKSSWIVCHDNLKATAETSTVLLTPWNTATSAAHWVKIPDACTRVLIRARCLVGISSVSTQPVVKLYVTDGTPNSSGAISGTPTASNFGEITRIDNADALAAGLTLTLATTGTNLEDATYAYSDPYDLTGFDCKGGSYFLMLTSTATNADVAVVGQCRFLN